MTTKPELVDMIDHQELLLMFRDYVDECIEESTPKKPVSPMGFDERKLLHEVFSTEIDVVLWWELAEGGQLCGSTSRPYQLRIPGGIVAENGAVLNENRLRAVARKFSNKMNRRLPWVIYREESIDHWTWQ